LTLDALCWLYVLCTVIICAALHVQYYWVILAVIVPVLALQWTLSRPKKLILPAYALVTGSSSGIGLDLAECFAKNGYHVILHGRNEDRLKEAQLRLSELYQVSVHYIAQDLADPMGAREIYEKAKEIAGNVPLSVLVNNAGLGSGGSLYNQSMESITCQIHTNMTALTILTRLCLPDMILRKHGKILNIASVAGFLPGPYASVYFSSKAFVVSLSQALTFEVEHLGVDVSCVCPGPVHTRFASQSGMESASLFNKLPIQSSADCAHQAYDALMRGKRLTGSDLLSHICVLVVRMLPPSWRLVVASLINT